MALARVVSFEGVTKDRIEELRRDISQGPRDDIPANEVVILHDPKTQKSLAMLFFETEDDYGRGDETLNAMPTGETLGRRSSLATYDVAIRTSA